MEYKQVKSINIEGVAFLARDMPTHTQDMPTYTQDMPTHTQDMPTHTQDMPTHQDVHTSGYSCGVQ